MLNSVGKVGLMVACVVAVSACNTTTNTRFNRNDNDVAVFTGDIDDRIVTLGSSGAEPEMPAPVDPGAAPSGMWVPRAGDFVLMDEQTGSLWNLNGEAYSGPLAGQRLTQKPGYKAFWFAWSTFYHGSEIWSRAETSTNTTAAIAGDGECEVPCNEISLGCFGGRDCIPALDFDGENDRPVGSMVSADDRQARYLDDDDFVLGVVVNGEARAYSHNTLWWHEIYNDKIGGEEFTVTFCPLTGSGIVFTGRHDGSPLDFEVSGNLYNSNLVMVDRATGTLWSQMLLRGVTGEQAGVELTVEPVVETTWARWREMHPDTLVTGEEQGYDRQYDRYPYGDYRTNHVDTFRPTNPDFEDTHRAKERVLGLIGSSSKRAYPLPALREVGDRVVLNDTFEEESIVVVYQTEFRLAIPYSSRVGDQELTFVGVEAP